MKKTTSFLISGLCLLLLLSFGQATASTQASGGVDCTIVRSRVYFSAFDHALYELGMSPSQAGSYALNKANQAYDACRGIAPA